MNEDTTCNREDDERLRVYGETRRDLLARQQSNSQLFDRAILSLSSALLAVSVAFIRGQDPLGITRAVWVLWVSWGAFGVAVISTILSFMSSQHAIAQQLEYAEQLYLEGDEDALERSRDTGSLTSRLNCLSGIAFIVGVVLTISFAIANLPVGGKDMPKDATDKAGFRTGGAPVPALQPTGRGAPEERGAPVPSLQPVTQPGSTPSDSGSPQGSGGSGGESSQGSGEQGSSASTSKD